MPFVWKLPNDPPDSTALERMKQHFRKPTQPMHAAWFMDENNYVKWTVSVSPEELIKGHRLGFMLDEIRSGITSFPKVSYVWKDWLAFLLPHVIAECESYFFADRDTILSLTLPSLIAIYRDGIVEEYAGFRNDLVNTLGTRYYCRHSSANTAPAMQSIYPLCPDDWDTTTYSGMPIPSVREDFSLALTFCLKYLALPEIEGWVQSLIAVDSPPWHLAIILWWLAYHKVLDRAEQWPNNGDIKQLLGDIGALKVSLISHIQFESLAAFIPTSNRVAYQQALAHELTFGLFQTWAADIRTKAIFADLGTNFLLGEYFMVPLDNLLDDFEIAFFHLP